MKRLSLAAVSLGVFLAQPAAAAAFLFNFSGTLGPRTAPGEPSVTPTPFSGRLQYEGGTTGDIRTTSGDATLFTDQYGSFHFTAYTAAPSTNTFTFSSIEQPGFALNVGRTSGDGPFSGTFSITASPTVNGTGTLAGSFATQAGAVPEPAVWLSMIVGFGLAGTFLRRRSVRGALLQLT